MKITDGQERPANPFLVTNAALITALAGNVSISNVALQAIAPHLSRFYRSPVTDGQHAERRRPYSVVRRNSGAVLVQGLFLGPAA
jgi:hypothetical protein